jgi:hypothetical protein
MSKKSRMRLFASPSTTMACSFSAIALGAGAYGCGSVPTVASTPERVITQLSVAPRQRINLPVGDSISLTATATDRHGTLLPEAGNVTWRSDPAVGVVSAGLFRATSSPGATWVIAETATGVRDSVFVATWRGAGTFHITLQYAADVPDRWRLCTFFPQVTQQLLGRPGLLQFGNALAQRDECGINFPALALIQRMNPQADDGWMAYSIATMKELNVIGGGDASTAGIGMMSEERWRQLADFMVQVQLIKPSTDWKSAFTNEFVKDLRITL